MNNQSPEIGKQLFQKSCCIMENTPVFPSAGVVPAWDCNRFGLIVKYARIQTACITI
jgi:hypothetical protein